MRIIIKKGFLYRDDKRVALKLSEISNIEALRYNESELVGNCWQNVQDRFKYMIKIITTNGIEDYNFYEISGLDKTQKQVDKERDKLISDIIDAIAA